MTEKPIPLRTPMVQAILRNEKTMDRRVLKPQPDALDVRYLGMIGDTGKAGFTLCHSGGSNSTQYIQTPYQVGDLLWVRETWAHYQTVNSRRLANGGNIDEISDGYAGYRADGFESIEDFRDHVRLMSDSSFIECVINGDRWRPSIHMPKWAARIWLRVTGVKVERLQDITRGDCMSEGCPFANMADGPDPREWFRELWDSLNDKRGHGWNANDWVAAITFERIER